MTLDQVLRTDNFQEQDARMFERKSLTQLIPTIQGVAVEKLEIV